LSYGDARAGKGARNHLCEAPCGPWTANGSWHLFPPRLRRPALRGSLNDASRELSSLLVGWAVREGLAWNSGNCFDSRPCTAIIRARVDTEVTGGLSGRGRRMGRAGPTGAPAGRPALAARMHRLPASEAVTPMTKQSVGPSRSGPVALGRPVRSDQLRGRYHAFCLGSRRLLSCH